MKKVKIFVVVVILGLIAVVGYQNKGFISETAEFHVFLYHPTIPYITLMAGLFLAGLLLAYFSTLLGRFKSKRAIKELTGQVASGQEKIAALEKELAGLKAGPQSLETMDGGADVAH